MISLRKGLVAEIYAHAVRARPAECCGLVSGCGNVALAVHPLRNVARDASVSYEAAPEELFAAQRLMRERGEQLLAIYHSHPCAAEPQPSDTDVRLAYYPAAVYLIVGLGGEHPVLRAFQISERERCWEGVEYGLID
jgi:[CysO sulfur-carrier protein]-S-L-cysteine hydrolase